MDVRWCYYTDKRPLWNEPRPDYVDQLWPNNATIMTRRKGVASPEGVPFFFTSCVGFQHALHTDAYYTPLEIRETKRLAKRHPAQLDLLQKAHPNADRSTPNLSTAAKHYLDSIGTKEDASIWMHSLAVGYSPQYRKENADGIRRDWPRIPLPDSNQALTDSATLGRQIAAMLDTESPVNGVTSGDIRSELRVTGVAARVGEGNLKESELALTAGWGHADKVGVVMPGKGKLIEREYSPAERKALLDGANTLGLSGKDLFALLGDKTCDAYLNDTAYWSNIPICVWDYTIGGYQVIKKWLSYREQPLLGRALTKDEVRYVQEMARRIAAILLLEPTLDANYEFIKQHTFSWPPKGGAP